MAKVRYIERRSRTDIDGVLDFETRKRKSWPGVTAEFVRFAPPEEFEFRLARSSSFVALFNIYRADGETAVPGLPRTSKKDLRNRLTFIPRDGEISGWSRIVKPASTIAVYFDHRFLADERWSLPNCPPMVEFEDTMLRSALLRFQAILDDPALDAPGYAETLGMLLAFEIGRLRNQSMQAAPLQGGLTTRQVRLVIDYLDSHLTDRITISELSKLLDLSRFHFIRAFKKTVGMPPHQFVVQRRIERAKELLANDRLSVIEVAERSGFNSNAQLTRAFRRVVGTTPTTFRRNA
jgi:AraC family transcriptional regulator